MKMVQLRLQTEGAFTSATYFKFRYSKQKFNLAIFYLLYYTY